MAHLNVEQVLSNDLQQSVPYFNSENFSTPIIIGGCHGGGTSITAKALRYLGVFLGCDSGNITQRKAHESEGFIRASEAIISHLNPGGSKVMGTTSKEEWNTFYSNLDDPKKFQEAVGNVHLRLIFRSYSFRVNKNQALKPLPHHFKYGWKDPRICPTIKVWKQIFPKARFIIVQAEHKKGPSKSHEGNWFKNVSDEATRRQYMYPRDLNLEKDNYYLFNYKTAFADVKKFNEFVTWIGLRALNPKQFASLKEKIAYKA